MSMENNDKYIAKSWIDDGTEEGFKKSFLESLLNQWQGEGNGFDADKLDGKHYCQIINDIDEKTKNLIPSFQIGNVHFNKDNIDANDGILKIGFDGVQLNVINEDGYEDYQKLPWDEEGTVRSGSPNLLETFEDLYNLINTKFENYNNDISDLIEFKQLLNENISYDNNDNVLINAQSVNGIRIYVKTPAQYQALKDAAALDPNSNEAKLINDDHNLFIINDGSELSDDIYAQQPGTQPISSYYQFKMDYKDVEDNNGIITREKWLYYKHADGNTWHEMCKTNDLIDTDFILQKFISFMGINSNYTLNPDSLNRSLDALTFNDQNYTSLNDYIRWSGVRGLTQTKYPNVELTSEPELNNREAYGSPRYVNLDNLIEKIEDVIDQKVEESWKNIYPLGAVFIAYDDIDPNTVFGGTWVRIEGRFLLAAGSVEDSAGIRYSYSTDNRLGGEVNHQLQLSEIPKHFHNSTHSHKPSLTDYHFVSTKKQSNNNAPNWRATVNKYTLPGSQKDNNGTYFMVTEDKSYVTQGATNSATVSTDEKGGNSYHNNMPPYIVVNVWRRIA